MVVSGNVLGGSACEVVTSFRTTGFMSAEKRQLKLFLSFKKIRAARSSFERRNVEREVKTRNEPDTEYFKISFGEPRQKDSQPPRNNIAYENLGCSMDRQDFIEFEIKQCGANEKKTLLMVVESSKTLHSNISAILQLSLAIAFTWLTCSGRLFPRPYLNPLPFASISSSRSNNRVSITSEPKSINFDSFTTFDDLEEAQPETEDTATEEQPKPPRTPTVVDDSIRIERLSFPSTVDPTHKKALESLQELGVIDKELNPEGICTRREFARWMVFASTILGRSTAERVFPAVYVEGLTEIAFDDLFPDDCDFQFIQGLAEAGLIPSKLSRFDSEDLHLYPGNTFYFHPDSPLTRQDLIHWKMNLDLKSLPKVSGEVVRRVSAFIDVNKIDRDILPSIAYDLSTGEDCIINTAFGYTRRFEPLKAVSHAQAAYVLGSGHFAALVLEEMERREAERVASEMEERNDRQAAEIRTMVQRQVAQERQLRLEAEKRLAEALEKIERVRAVREEEQATFRATQESITEEREILVNLRSRTEKELAALSSGRKEVEQEQQRLAALRSEAEQRSLALEEAKIQTEVERQSLAIAKTWAEEEARRSQEESKKLRALRRRIRTQQLARFSGVQADAETSPEVAAEVQEAEKTGAPSMVHSMAVTSTVFLSMADFLVDIVRGVALFWRSLSRLLTACAIWSASVAALQKERVAAFFRMELVKLKSLFRVWH